MNEQKPTPGPWRTDTDIFHDRLDIRDESGRRIAVCMHDYPMSMARHDANAHLLAAAPDMLEALEKAKAFLVTAITRGEVKMSDYEELVSDIENTINKAKGDSENN